MICLRHNALAETTDDHDWPLCSACFQEAKGMAEAKALETKIRTLRADNSPSLTQSSAAWLVSRLGWTE